jgi:preprotein translocase subunit SecA
VKSNVVTDLKSEAYDSKGKQLVADFLKNITLAIVDEAWKKTPTQNGRIETIGSISTRAKDPLLIYKFEAFNLFNAMLNRSTRELFRSCSRRSTTTKCSTIQKQSSFRRKLQNVKDEIQVIESANMKLVRRNSASNERSLEICEN